MTNMNTVTHNTDKRNDGLRLAKTNEGYWIIIQESVQETVLRTRTGAQAKRAMKELLEIGCWDINESVVERMKKMDQELYDKYLILHEAYHVERRDNISYMDTVDTDGMVTYFIKSSSKQEWMKVKGEPISWQAEGLCIRKITQGNETKFVLDHPASGLTTFKYPSKEMARDMGQFLNSLLDWSQSKAVKLIFSHSDLEEYIIAVAKSIIRKEKIPSISQELEFKLVFLQTPSIADRWPIFRGAWRELEGMSGLSNIKEQVSRLVARVRGEMRSRGKVEIERGGQHMVFAGPPGTGKTQVARIIIDLFYAMGYLPKRKIVEIDRGQIVGAHIGHTEENMARFLEEAKGGGLFIDEAYALAQGGENDFGHQAINMLLTEMENDRSGFVTILAGYPNDMDMLLQSNEGFRSRVRRTMRFHNYTIPQLLEISKRMLTGKRYRLKDGVENALERAIEQKAKDGVLANNARDVRNLVEDIIDVVQARIGKDREAEADLILKVDVENACKRQEVDKSEEVLEKERSAALDALENLIGMDELKIRTRIILNQSMAEKKRRELGLKTERGRMHMVFAGPSGTGKTTVAKIIGRFLKGTGILSSGHFTKVTRSGLVGAYQGHSAKKVKEQVTKALGGVLLIDEAYSLINGEGDSFGQEAVAELIDLMEEYREDLVVILAGYKRDMESLFDYNEGFRSRIGHTFYFIDYTVEEICEIVHRTIFQRDFLLDEEAKGACMEAIHRHAEQEDSKFEGNGRWAVKFVDELIAVQSNRLMMKNDTADLSIVELQTLTAEDVRCINTGKI